MHVELEVGCNYCVNGFLLIPRLEQWTYAKYKNKLKILGTILIVSGLISAVTILYRLEKSKLLLVSLLPLLSSRENDQRYD